MSPASLRISRGRVRAAAILGAAAAAVIVFGFGGRFLLAPDAVPRSVPSAATAATVDRVIDGDTIDVNLSDGSTKRVRLLGIDTPETVNPHSNDECFGPEASAETARLLPAGLQVYLERDATQGDVDRYGRQLAYVWTGAAATMINLQLLETGYATEYTYRDAYTYQNAFREAQTAAQHASAGLWAADVC